MAEDREGLAGQEQIIKDPEKLINGVRDRATGFLDTVIDRNPMIRTYSENFGRVQKALPEGRMKAATGLVLDALKLPMAFASAGIETAKVLPFVRGALAIPESAFAVAGKIGGFFAEKTVESKPIQYAVGSVENVMYRILGGGRQQETVRAVFREPVTTKNARQVLVGMARPETGKQERRKMT